MMNVLRLLAVGIGLVSVALPSTAGADPTILRVIPSSNLTILDPIWTTAIISQNHGYMIYDTLFGTDEKGEIKPQMVEKFTISPDKKAYTFTLREGLAFHDEKPVTSEDVIASLQRWGKRDVMGQQLMRFADNMEAVDQNTFRIVLREPYGLVLESLGKVGPNVPFIMPKRVAATPADKQIDDYTGSGPYIFKKDEWRPGEKIVYLKNPKYKPRSEPPSGTAGGKIVKVDRVEWVIIKDAQTQANALMAGEVDIIPAVPFELYRSLKTSKSIEMSSSVRRSWQAVIRFNHLLPPFDNPKVRQAALAAINQEAFLRAQVGIPELYRTCASIYPCDSAYATTRGLDLIAKPDMKLAQQLLKDSGYDGTPVVLMQPTDIHTIDKLPLVAAQLLRQAGFKVDMQAMDWQTLVSRRAKKDPPTQGGWNAFLTIWLTADLVNPVANPLLNGSCDKALFGWPCDPELERLRDQFARASDESERKSLAEQVQVRAMATVTHVPLGEYVLPLAARKGITGIVVNPLAVYWNIGKE